MSTYRETFFVVFVSFCEISGFLFGIVLTDLLVTDLL